MYDGWVTVARIGVPVVIPLVSGYLTHNSIAKRSSSAGRSDFGRVRDFSHGNILPEQAQQLHCWEVKNCPAG